MKLRIIHIVLLILLLPVYAQAVNGIQPTSVFPEPYGYAQQPVQFGWYNCTQAWFICRTTNSVQLSYRIDGGNALTVTPKLSSALVPKVVGGEIAARPAYYVLNYPNPTVFSTAPGQNDYSALWQIFTVTWKRGVTPRPIYSSEPASPSNPNGLPDASQADIVATDIVADCPILIVGPLTNHVARNGSGYKIAQSGTVDIRNKRVFMPVWLVYCQDPLTKRIDIDFAQITDVSDQALATLLGANLAPGLLNMPDADTTDFYVMRGPKPPSQLPLVLDCPNDIGVHNSNYDYSPVMKYVILKRNIPATTLIKSVNYLEFLLTNGGLDILKDDQRINAQIIIPNPG